MTDREGLKPLDEILKPDIRHSFFKRFDLSTGDIREQTLECHYARVEKHSLNDSVPEKIAIQYDVARNIYIYAWYEYRFFNVAEAQVLTVLELAMKELIGELEIKAYIKKRKQEHKQKTGKGLSLQKGMKTMMEYCRDHNLVRNEGFTQWKHYASQQAYYTKQAIRTEWADREMKRTGKTEIELPEIVWEDLPPDPNYDHVQHLIDCTNKVRNSYAHGSTSLHNMVVNRFEMVSEFINQIFENKEVNDVE